MGIDYGSAYTKAVLVLPGGQWTLVKFDGGPALSNAVHVGPSGISVGAAAWQGADTGPAGFIASPLRVGDGTLHVSGVDLEPADLIAATLRRVAAEASVLAGGPVEDVRMVVPAGWGPRRRTWWRRVAGKAGLGQVRLLEAPIATAAHLVSDRGVAGDGCWLIVDVGAGCEVSVVRRAPGAEFEVLSTMADADAGGSRIDAALVEAATGSSIDGFSAFQRPALLASVEAVKHALLEQPAVTMLVPDRPPVVVNTALLRRVARPVFDRVGELAAAAVANAEMVMADVGAVYAVGATMMVPGAAEMIAGKLGVPPQVIEQPGFVAVLGAADAPTARASEATVSGARGPGLPPLRRLAGLALPGVLSLLLYAHFVFSAEFNNGTPATPTRFYYVLASWGELAVAATLAVLTCLQAAALIGALLPGRPAGGAEAAGLRGGSISSGVVAAAAGGLAIASLYAVTAAVYFAKPVGGLLRWSVAPVLPIVVCAVLLAVVVWRRPAPAGGWDALLAFPLSSSVAAAVGTFAISVWGLGHLPIWLNGWQSVLGYFGGLLLSVAISCALVRDVLVRAAVTLVLGFFCLIISRSGPGILAVIYAVAVTAWWAHQTWVFFRAARPVDGSREVVAVVGG